MYHGTGVNIVVGGGIVQWDELTRRDPSRCSLYRPSPSPLREIDTRPCFETRLAAMTA